MSYLSYYIINIKMIKRIATMRYAWAICNDKFEYLWINAKYFKLIFSYLYCNVLGTNLSDQG